MPSYTITAVQPNPREWSSTKGGPMLSYRITLKNEAGAEKQNVEWARKATSAPPAVGQTVEGTVEDGQYGPKFKQAQQMGGGGGGGGGGRQMPPEERRMIAMQASQKVAVDAVVGAMTAGLWKPDDPQLVASAVLAVSDRLYLRVLDAQHDRIKPQQ